MGQQTRQRDKQHKTTPHDNTEDPEARTLVSRRPFLSGLTGVATLGLGGVAGGKNNTKPADQRTIPSTQTSVETDEWKQLVKLLSTDNAKEDRFGQSVSLDGDGETVLIGAYLDDDNGPDSGSAYIFSKDNEKWSQAAKLIADDGAENDIFGRSVALSDDGETAIVGAVNSNVSGSDSGAAYIFTKNDGQWSQTAKLTADDDDQAIAFGLSVTLDRDGKTALIGASVDKVCGSYSGAAYIFKKNDGQWSQMAKLTADDETEHDRFGGSVALDDDGKTALIGDSFDDENGTNSGSAYIFTKADEEWHQTTKFTPDESSQVRGFGVSVSFDCAGETALIGSTLGDDEPTELSSAFIFTKNDGQWTQTTKLTAADGDPGDSFGRSVEIDNRGETALIGALSDDDNGALAGSTYFFTKDDEKWNQTAKFTADDGDKGDRVGLSVSLDRDGETALIGASFDENEFEWAHAGSAYVFSKE